MKFFQACPLPSFLSIRNSGGKLDILGCQIMVGPGVDGLPYSGYPVFYSPCVHKYLTVCSTVGGIFLA